RERESGAKKDPNLFEMSLTAIGSGEEPPSKKLAIEPTTNLPLPDELVLGCFARASRLPLPDSLTRLQDLSFAHFFTGALPDPISTKPHRETVSTCACSSLMTLASAGSLSVGNPTKPLTTRKRRRRVQQVAMSWVRFGFSLYAVRDGPCSSDVFFLDCRTHTWVETPSLRLAHTFPECDGMIILPGGSESPDSLNFVQVHKLGSPCLPRRRYSDSEIYKEGLTRNNDVAAGVVSWLVVARLKDRTVSVEGSGTLCLIEKAFYRYASSSGELLWSNRSTESDVWRKVKGLEGLPNMSLHVGYKEKMIVCVQRFRWKRAAVK
ncbi:LOW QUALITY PROTEIN: hypothetical protein HID58_096193, partial [Brassica napus]